MSREVRTSRKQVNVEAAASVAFDSGLHNSCQIKFAHQLFEEQAQRAPDQLAVICAGRSMSYGQLDARADQLAHHLRARGVGPDTLVAMSVERSLEMVAGILGVLKAGGAYVPLDPTYPKERLELMIADSAPRILLTQSHLVAGMPACEGSTLLLDAIQYATCNGGAENSTPKNCANDLAYVIYKSGSTGNPKGVMITQGNLATCLQSMQRATGVTESDVYLHTASISLSSAVRQLMVPLSLGATIVIATTDEIRDPIALLTTIKQVGVTIIDIVPSYWRSCVDALIGLRPASRLDLLENDLRLILFANEPLSPDVPRVWRYELNHQAQLINMFGQTETAGIVATYPIALSAKDTADIVPIGRSIDNVRIYLLNARLKPVAAGESGEICIGGPTVGRGYLNHPELTAEKFSRDPFAESSDARLYRTGNLGRLGADGNLELQGRIDKQAKTHARRVEPAEIARKACRRFHV